ncbi:MAG: cyclic nucleotide-binding domain-containing protein [Gallionellaceae bacterium]|jgi:CRP-like cAMP-binding protein/thioredoxin reductase/Fe-S-cluster-containing dehydrogenase component
MSEFQIAIIGAGPGGLAAAARAAKLGVSHVLLEASGNLANTIYNFQKRKYVMAEPARLPLRGEISFAAASREQILQAWQHEVTALGVNLKLHAAVSGIQGERGNFAISLATGELIAAQQVILAIGLQGNVRKLGVAGETLSGVQYQLADPDEYVEETIVVVGAGDAGVENALALANKNKVFIINRNEEFSSCKAANLALLETAIKAGKVAVRTGARTEKIEINTDAKFPLNYFVNTPHNKEIIPCHRVIARLGALPPRKLVESFGVRFPNAEPTAVPQLSEHYESNVAGLYIIGALAGCPLIKQAMNQGYEVVEHILGHEVTPADEVLLQEKFTRISVHLTVAEGISLLRRNHPLLNSLTTLQLREVVLESTITSPEPETVLFHQLDFSSSLYSILQGEVEIHIAMPDAGTKVIKLFAGDFFGEIGLLSGRRRSGTAIAGKDCILIETPRSAMLKLLTTNESVQRSLDEVSLKRIIRSNLGGEFTEQELDDLVHGSVLKRYNEGDLFFKEKDAVDGLYMIRRGSVTVSREIEGKETVLGYVAAGNYFGEMALLSNQPRSATVRAATYTEAVLLHADQVKLLLSRNAAMRRNVDSTHLKNLQSNANNKFAESSEMVRFLVDQGIGEGTDVLLIDYDRCLRCDNCEYACAQVHDGVSLLHRRAGVTFHNIHIPTSCRHCEHPHCMKDCPPDAIRRSSSGEVYIAESCIGCGNCQRNCPYGVITMLSPAKQHVRTNFWAVIFGEKQHVGENRDEHKKASKCDMCKGLADGPACVHSCPSGAAMRLSPEEVMEALS